MARCVARAGIYAVSCSVTRVLSERPNFRSDTRGREGQEEKGEGLPPPRQATRRSVKATVVFVFGIVNWKNFVCGTVIVRIVDSMRFPAPNPAKFRKK